MILKNFLLFVFFGLLFSEFYQNATYDISYVGTGNANFINLSTDFYINPSFRVFSSSTRIFLPKLDQNKQNVEILDDSIYMCPGKLNFISTVRGRFHINAFNGSVVYYAPIGCQNYICNFACNCSNSVNQCKDEQFSAIACRSWQGQEVNLLNPHPLTFTSNSDFDTLLNSPFLQISRNSNNFNYFLQFLNNKRELANLFPFTTPTLYYPLHKVFSTIFVKGEYGLEQSTGNNIDFFVQSFGPTTDGQNSFSTAMTFTNNNQDTFIKGVTYKGQIYNLRPTAKVSNSIIGVLPLPIDQSFSTIFLYARPSPTITPSLNQKISTKNLLKVYIVEPDDCSEIDIIDVSPNPVPDLKPSKEQILEVAVSSPYELFGMKAKSVQMVSPTNWKIEPVDGFGVSFSNSHLHMLKVKLTPTTIVFKKNPICFEIVFEADTPFCDGKICSTTKKVCVTPLLKDNPYCVIESSVKGGNIVNINVGDSINLTARCYLDKKEFPCPDLSWKASGFNIPPSKVERVSLTEIGKPKPFPPFYPPGNERKISTSQTSNPQGITLHTYSRQDTLNYGIPPTPQKPGKIIVSEITNDLEKLECSIGVNINSTPLPDLVPVIINKTMKFDPNNPFPTFSLKWGVRNEKIQILKPKKDSPLSDAIPVEDEFTSINTDVNVPFNISLYLYDSNTKNYVLARSFIVNGLKAGQTYIVEEFSYVCPAPIYKDAMVVVDVNNNVLEINENNNKQTEAFNCIYRLICPDFI